MAWEPAMIYNIDKVITYNSPPSSNLSHQKLKYCYHNFYLSLSFRNISKRYHSFHDSVAQGNLVIVIEVMSTGHITVQYHSSYSIFWMFSVI